MADTDYLAASDGTGDAALMHVTSPRVALATIIQVDTVVGVPAFFIGTWGTLLASGFIDPTTKRDFFGHVNAGTLVIDKMAPGNVDGGNTTGQVVVIKPSTPVQNLVGNFVKTALNNFGEGQLLNGKIVPSIATNNLVVAIKTLNGVDPSTTDVVYVRIGNTIRSITAPLSVTLAAGTNWFGKGSAPFATLATTFSVYLGYNTTDGVTIGVASIANGLQYSDFSTTNTNWTYAKISTITNATSTDVYENVGRFNAILGVTATFLWTLPASNISISQPSQAAIQYPYRFAAYHSAGQSLGAGVWTKLAFNTKEYDLGSNYDNVTNNRFTAPVAGFYRFSAATEITGNGGESYAIGLYKNGSEIKRGVKQTLGAGTTTFELTVVPPALFLAAGDYIEVFAFNGSGGGKTASAGQLLTYFGGELGNPV